MNAMHLLKRLIDHTPPKPATPLDEQLIDAARVLTATDRELAVEVADVIAISRGEISDSLYAVFEDLLVTLRWHEEHPDEEHVADARALLALIRKVAI
ncbi:hypothetical protein [Saccharopolyspora taberi]|uniref:Uncharacterized protein n=1 Tax=Saccharopolyspora taberi TaxID=60895 RepID=A0ABN3V4R8_9PSEU